MSGQINSNELLSVKDRFQIDEQILFKHISAVWEVFLHEMSSTYDYEKQGIRIQLSEPVLTEAVLTAVSDICRMVSFHFREVEDSSHQKYTGPDRHKYSAFLARWIAKMRPVNFFVPNEIDPPFHLYQINAFFALYVFRSFLTQNVPDEVVPSLIYSFHYREIAPEILAILAYAGEEISSLREAQSDSSR